MSRTPHFWVIVPMLNEVENLPRLTSSFRTLVAELPEFETHILIVDDGSTDGTADTARQLSHGLNLEVLSHATNRGPGQAFATAFASLAGRLDPSDWVVTIEGDNTSRTELIRQMITRASEGFDVVLASPYLYGGGISNTSLYRTLLSHVANVLVKEWLGIHGIVTMSSFFRLYRAGIILHLQHCYGDAIIDRAGFECMVELLLKLVRVGATISEVAMPLDGSLRLGKSKMKTLKTARNYLTLWQDKGRWQKLGQSYHATRGRAHAVTSD